MHSTNALDMCCVRVSQLRWCFWLRIIMITAAAVAAAAVMFICIRCALCYIVDRQQFHMRML